MVFHFDFGDDADVYVGHNVDDNFVSIETLSKTIYIEKYVHVSH